MKWLLGIAVVVFLLTRNNLTDWLLGLWAVVVVLSPIWVVGLYYALKRDVTNEDHSKW